MTTAPTMTLAEKFAALPPRIQRCLFRVLDVVIGASQDEKTQARLSLEQAARDERIGETLTALSTAQAGLFWHAHLAAEGQPTPPAPESPERSYADQLAALPEDVQVPLLSLLDFAVELSDTDRATVCQSLAAASRTRRLSESTRMATLMTGTTVWKIGQHRDAVRQVRNPQDATEILAAAITTEG